MRIQRVAAAVVCLSCALWAASCVQRSEPAAGTEGVTDGEPPTESARGMVEPVSEAAEEDAFLGTIRCRKSEYGMDCADRCGNAGMFCSDLRPHPTNRDAGNGAASGCDSGGSKGTTCRYYYYATGETCVFYPRRSRPPLLCVSDGG